MAKDDRAAKAEARKAARLEEVKAYNARRDAKIPDPMTYLIFGFLLQFAGGILFGLGISGDVPAMLWISVPLASVGAVLVLIGAIARGVIVGLRVYNYDFA